MRDAISTRSRAISIWYPRRLSFKTRIVRSIRNTRSTRITRRIDRFTYRREGWERKESEKRANRERIEPPQKQKGIREVNILFPSCSVLHSPPCHRLVRRFILRNTKNDPVPVRTYHAGSYEVYLTNIGLYTLPSSFITRTMSASCDSSY